MTKTIELSGGKVIDLNRFVALVPNKKAVDRQYHLILEGSNQAILLDSQEAISVKEHLKMEAGDGKPVSSSSAKLLKSKQNANDSWDTQEQIRKNQPAIELLKQRIARNKLMSEEESNQRIKFLADFQKTVDEQRMGERELYSPQ